jgi:hypothetical protein
MDPTIHVAVMHTTHQSSDRERHLKNLSQINTAPILTVWITDVPTQ